MRYCGFKVTSGLAFLRRISGRHRDITNRTIRATDLRRRRLGAVYSTLSMDTTSSVINAFREPNFDDRLLRLVAGVVLLMRGAWLRLIGKRYRAIEDFCWVVRSSRAKSLEKLARRAIDDVIEATRRAGYNLLAEAFRADRASNELAMSYALAGPGPHDLLRDLLVLKSPSAKEKGVILLKYARTFSATVALLDVARLMERYTFVLEPCWAGYCHPALLMFVAPGNPVIVQCF